MWALWRKSLKNNRKEKLGTAEIDSLIKRWNSKPLGDEIKCRYFYSIPRNMLTVSTDIWITMGKSIGSEKPGLQKMLLSLKGITGEDRTGISV